MKEYRCKFCHKLLFKIKDIPYEGQVIMAVQIKCSKCKKIIDIEIIALPARKIERIFNRAKVEVVFPRVAPSA